MPTLYANPGSYVPKNGTFFKPNEETNNLTITHNLNDIHYRANGSGRDGYIYLNNGGLMSHD